MTNTDLCDRADVDRAAREDALVRANLSVVRKAVADLSARMPRHAARDDLLSAGMVGLAQAARNFDESRGVPFHRYAATRVNGALLDELRANDWATRPVRARARQADRVSEHLMAKLGRKPSPQEVAAEMGVDVEVVRGLTDDLHRATVLNYDSMVATGDSEAVLLVDDADPEGELVERERSAYLVDAVKALPERLRTVVLGYFFLDRPMAEIGAELGVTESRVSQLRAEALDLLRDGMNSQLEPELVEMPDVPVGRVQKRKAAYFSAIADASTPNARLDSRPRA